MSQENKVKYVAGIMLSLFALFFGGCSAFFADLDLRGGGFGAYPIWGAGLALAALCAYGALRLLFPPKPPLTGSSEDSGSANKPAPPPDP